ncbi:MAG: hypothetical protein JSV70_06105 [bacterium]|nr:MAG: hypothetical protein JSV70_06105 [bacterium]
MKKQNLPCAAGAVTLFIFLAALAIPAAASHDGPDVMPEFIYYIQDTDAYYLPDPEVDIFFSLGRWYRRSGGSWSVGVSFRGPWGSIALSSVPSVLVGLPPDFRATRRFGRVPYRYLQGHRESHDDYGRSYYGGRYDDDHDRSRYKRHWHPEGGFWFFVAPDFDHDDGDDSHRRRRRRGR